MEIVNEVIIVDHIPLSISKSLYVDNESFKDGARIVVITTEGIFTTVRIDKIDIDSGNLIGKFKLIIKLK